MKGVHIISLLFAFALMACSEYTPKPRGYQRIDAFDTNKAKYTCPEFSFTYSAGAKIEKVVKEEKSSGLWFNISYPLYNAIVYCTYLPVSKADLPGALEDSYHLAYSQSLKASGIQQTQYSDSLSYNTGIIYDIKGQVVSPVQFYITDNRSNFLRGALYFGQIVKPDSVAPVVNFLRSDIVNIMESLEWSEASCQ